MICIDFIQQYKLYSDNGDNSYNAKDNTKSNWSRGKWGKVKSFCPMSSLYPTFPYCLFPLCSLS